MIIRARRWSSACFAVLHDAQEVAKQDDDGDFADGGHVDGGVFFYFRPEVLHSHGQCGGFAIFNACTNLLCGEIHAHAAVFQQMRRELVRVAWDAGDHDVALRHEIREARLPHLQHLVLRLADALASRELLHAAHVDAVDVRAVVGEEGRERSADDFAAVHDADRVPEEPVAVGQDRVVDAQVLEDFDDRERRAGEDGLALRGCGVEEADVLVHVEDVLVGEAFDVFGEGDELLQVLILP